MADEAVCIASIALASLNNVDVGRQWQQINNSKVNVITLIKNRTNFPSSEIPEKLYSSHKYEFTFIAKFEQKPKGPIIGSMKLVDNNNNILENGEFTNVDGNTKDAILNFIEVENEYKGKIRIQVYLTS